jgi:septum site-determining protein MinD
MPGTLYTVASAKGGVGKTTTALNLAVAFREAGAETAVVDADLGMTNLGDLAGVETDVSVHDVLTGAAPVEAALVEGPGGVDILAGDRGIDAYNGADPARLRDVLAVLSDAYDVILADTGTGLRHATLVACGLADGVVLVTTPEDVAVADTRKTADMVRRVDGTVLGVGVLRTRGTTDRRAIANQVGEPLLGAVPEFSPTPGDEPMVLADPESRPAKAYRQLADRVDAARLDHQAPAGAAGLEQVAGPAQD